MLLGTSVGLWATLRTLRALELFGWTILAVSAMNSHCQVVTISTGDSTTVDTLKMWPFPALKSVLAVGQVYQWVELFLVG